MAREEFLDELSNDFPPQRIYSYDENIRYLNERRELMDAVLDGTFETYECKVKECGFHYKISADADFLLEVSYGDDSWRKTFPYIAEAFDIAEAAYRFFVVVPRVLDEGEANLSNEKSGALEPESRKIEVHCLEGEVAKPVELITPPHYRVKGEYVFATVFRCTDGIYALSVMHRRGGKESELLEKYFTDADFAELMADKYLEIFDRDLLGPPEDLYACVYKRLTH